MRNIRELLNGHVTNKWAVGAAAGTLVVGGLTGTALAHNSPKPLCYASSHYEKYLQDGVLASVLPNGNVFYTDVHQPFEGSPRDDLVYVQAGRTNQYDIIDANLPELPESPLLDNGSTYKLVTPTGLEAYNLQITVNTAAHFVTAQCVVKPEVRG